MFEAIFYDPSHWPDVDAGLARDLCEGSAAETPHDLVRDLALRAGVMLNDEQATWTLTESCFVPMQDCAAFRRHVWLLLTDSRRPQQSRSPTP